VTERVGDSQPTLKERLALAWRRLRGGALSPGRAAASVAVGLFVGALPFYGVQILIVLAVCLPLRLDAAVAYLAAHVSNPLTLPFLLLLELEVGSLLLTGHDAPLDLASAKKLAFSDFALQIGLGALVVGTALAVAGGGATWAVAHGVRDALSRSVALARQRTLRRYARASRGVRFYVQGKLRMDPALASISRLGALGRTIDAGSGVGQLGLALLDLGHATSLVGIDDDAAKIAVAQAAGGGEARFVTQSLSEAQFPEADTILFVDSLHYFSIALQDAVLASAARSLAPGGRLVIREVDARPTVRSALTQWLERRASTRHDPSQKPGFRSAVQLAEALERLGLRAKVSPHDEFSVFDNALVVGEKPLPAAS